MIPLEFMSPSIEVTADKDNIRIIFDENDFLVMPIQRKSDGKVFISGDGGFYHEAATIEELVNSYMQVFEE